MTRGRPQNRGFTLVELIIVIAAVGGTLFVLGKLLLDGIYLQRVAAQHANQVAVTDALTKRLRADALGAAACAWEDGPSGPTLLLHTYAEGRLSPVQWTFEPNRVIRRDAGREAGLFDAERLGFAARCETTAGSSVLALDLLVAPPARAAGRPPRLATTYVLLPPKDPQESAPASEEIP